MDNVKNVKNFASKKLGNFFKKKWLKFIIIIINWIKLPLFYFLLFDNILYILFIFSLILYI